MNATLVLHCRLEKITSDGTLAEWLNDVSCVDDLLRTKNANFQALAKSSREASGRTSTFAEPSCRSYTNNNNTIPASANHTAFPKLTEVEHQLLYNNDGCLKCRHVFITHLSTDCPNNFPEAANYQPLTQLFVDLIKKHVRKPVAGSSNNDDASMSSVPTPMAAVMGMMSNPVAYTAPNLTSVLKGDSFSDESMSIPNPRVTALPIRPPVPASSVLTAPYKDLAPLTVLHLYCKCSVNGAENEFPVVFDALLDHGADTVFISEHFASKLSLKRQKLYQPMSVKMAMPGEGEKQIVNMSKWVKLQLHNPSGGWKSKAIQAIVAPSLCSPVILGLLFLSHNKIVIDHEA